MAVGRVALKQALRKQGATYKKIAELTDVSIRTAWDHIQARSGSNIRSWEKRSKKEQQAALLAAAKLLIGEKKKKCITK